MKPRISVVINTLKKEERDHPLQFGPFCLRLTKLLLTCTAMAALEKSFCISKRGCIFRGERDLLSLHGATLSPKRQAG